MKLSIITLTSNHLDLTKKFIDSLYKYTDDFELIIVDNGSTDGTCEYLKTLKDAKIIYNKENKGYSVGNNQGIELANGEYIGFLNNDILVYPNWFEKLKYVFEKEPTGFVSPKHIHPHYDNTDEIQYISYFKKKRYRLKYEKSFDECVFSCVITKRKVLDKIGVFDENYSPAFFEDNDLKCRAISQGYGVFVSNEVCFFHFGSKTSKKYNYNFEQNRNYYYSKFPLAEYLSISQGEKYELQRMTKQFNMFPLNMFYSISKIFIKTKKRLVKVYKQGRVKKKI